MGQVGPRARLGDSVSNIDRPRAYETELPSRARASDIGRPRAFKSLYSNKTYAKFAYENVGPSIQMGQVGPRARVGDSISDIDRPRALKWNGIGP